MNGGKQNDLNSEDGVPKPSETEVARGPSMVKRDTSLPVTEGGYHLERATETSSMVVVARRKDAAARWSSAVKFATRMKLLVLNIYIYTQFSFFVLFCFINIYI